MIESPEPELPHLSEGPARRRPFGPLWVQVLVGILLGIAIGAIFPHFGVALKPFGDAFIRLIRMTLPPIIFATVETISK
jgi:aerobic C4-dicarboxylate transport protein